MKFSRETIKMRSIGKMIFAGLLSLPAMVSAGTDIPDVITVKKMSMELAAEIATKAVKTCRDLGYQVTAVVVDRNGNAQVMMRDVHASRFTAQIAEEKANAVILGGVSSGEIRNNRQDIRQELNHVNGILIMQGGLPIRAAGSILGAVGVSGAPGGDKDETCAKKALDSVQERLDFAE
jgi:uncharacterized protein GlcG (DUF336 family)